MSGLWCVRYTSVLDKFNVSNNKIKSVKIFIAFSKITFSFVTTVPRIVKKHKQLKFYGQGLPYLTPWNNPDVIWSRSKALSLLPSSIVFIHNMKSNDDLFHNRIGYQRQGLRSTDCIRKNYTIWFDVLLKK